MKINYLMNNIETFNNFKLNENMHIASKKKLRDSIHDIMFDELEPGEEMDTTELSKILNDKYKINISAKILDHIIFVLWWKDDDYTIFRKKDKSWLDVWPYKKTVERKKKRIPSLGKGRRKAEKEEREKKYKYNYYGYNYNDNYYKNKKYKPKNYL